MNSRCQIHPRSFLSQIPEQLLAEGQKQNYHSLDHVVGVELGQNLRSLHRSLSPRSSDPSQAQCCGQRANFLTKTKRRTAPELAGIVEGTCTLRADNSTCVATVEPHEGSGTSKTNRESLSVTETPTQHAWMPVGSHTNLLPVF